MALNHHATLLTQQRVFGLATAITLLEGALQRAEESQQPLLIAETEWNLCHRTMITYATHQIEGISLFYREAGDPQLPTIVLLGGFPSSSYMFRDLLPALADQFHIIAPDYPGFGQTEMPDPRGFAYTFDHLVALTEQLLTELGGSRAGWYLQDYGGLIGNRILGRHPDWLEWLITQNANTCEEGFTGAWDALRHALWVNRTQKPKPPSQASSPLRPSAPSIPRAA